MSTVITISIQSVVGAGVDVGNGVVVGLGVEVGIGVAFGVVVGIGVGSNNSVTLIVISQSTGFGVGIGGHW